MSPVPLFSAGQPIGRHPNPIISEVVGGCAHHHRLDSAGLRHLGVQNQTC